MAANHRQSTRSYTAQQALDILMDSDSEGEQFGDITSSESSSSSSDDGISGPSISTDAANLVHRENPRGNHDQGGFVRGRVYNRGHDRGNPRGRGRGWGRGMGRLQQFYEDWHRNN